ncbi:MAG TPA: DNA polymerase III subunit alpha, partial [Dissulfurispiraceae bacterium]
LLSSGETTGIFQLESDGMRDILVKMQPNRFEDLIALVALYRPGPIGSGMIDDFIKRKRGETEVEYELPQLKEILDETYGVILYQEQVMRIANRIASFSLGQADLLRRAMGKKKPEEMEKQKEFFLSGAAANGIPEKKAARLFELMAFFAEYGFNKSHSAAYAYLAYQTAYLKMHYTVEFMTANLSADMGDTDRIVKLINECRNLSMEILPPDINESAREFKIVGSSVRFGLEAVKGVGSSAIEIILQERQNGRFQSFDEFLSRTDNKRVNKKVVESLIKAGAFDTVCKSGNESSNHARAKAMGILKAPPKSRDMGPGLFGDSCIQEEEVQPWDENMLLGAEKESLGFYVSGHPLSRYRRKLSLTGVSRISSLEELEDRADICIAGIVSEMRSRAKEKGVTAYPTLEDETGSCEVLIFPDLYRKNADLLKKGALLLIRGQGSKAEKGTKVIAREIQDLSNMEISLKYEVSLRCTEPEEMNRKLRSIRGLLDASGSGKRNASVSFKFYLPECCVIITSGLQPLQNFPAEVEKITGEAVKVVEN